MDLLEHELREAMRDCTNDMHAAPQLVQQVIERTSVPRRVSRVRLGIIGLCLGALTVPAGLATAGQGELHAAFPWLGAPAGDGGPPEGPLNASDAQLVGSAPGPDGTTARLYLARDPQTGSTCLLYVFEGPRAASAAPTQVEQMGSYCPASPTPRFAFGGDLSLGAGQVATDGRPGTTVFTVNAGDAVRAELRDDQTGKTYPALLADNTFFGWYPDARPISTEMTGRVVLTGYRADGSIVDQATLEELSSCPRAGWAGAEGAAPAFAPCPTA